MSDDYNKVKGLYLSQAWDYETPVWLFESLREIFNFTLDAAADSANTKCDRFINEKTNALTVDWETEGLWWLNPPWGRKYKEYSGYDISDWMRHAFEQYEKGNEGVAIVSARTDTKSWWHKYVIHAPYVLFPKGRVAFYIDKVKKTQPNFPSALIIFIRVLTGKQIQKLNKLGWLVEPVHY